MSETHQAYTDRRDTQRLRKLQTHAGERLGYYDKVTRAEAAVHDLKCIARFIRPSEFPQLAEKIRSTIKSAEGALRNAEAHEARAQRDARKQFPSVLNESCDISGGRIAPVEEVARQVQSALSELKKGMNPALTNMEEIRKGKK